MDSLFLILLYIWKTYSLICWKLATLTCILSSLAQIHWLSLRLQRLLISGVLICKIAGLGFVPGTSPLTSSLLFWRIVCWPPEPTLYGRKSTNWPLGSEGLGLWISRLLPSDGPCTIWNFLIGTYRQVSCGLSVALLTDVRFCLWQSRGSFFFLWATEDSFSFYCKDIP